MGRGGGGRGAAPRRPGADSLTLPDSSIQLTTDGINEYAYGIGTPSTLPPDRPVRDVQRDVDADAALLVAGALSLEIGRTAAVRIEHDRRDALRDQRASFLQRSRKPGCGMRNAPATSSHFFRLRVIWSPVLRSQ